MNSATADLLSECLIQPSDCITWPGSTNKKGGGGYGMVMRGGRRWLTHVYVFTLESGAEPSPGMEVMHTCDVKPCFNPGHLKLGTHHENMLDAAAKGRMGKGRRFKKDPRTVRRGENHWNARIPESTAIGILSATGKTASIARRFGVSWETANCIRKRKTWRHLPL